MGNLINRKRAKAFAILDELGAEADAEAFAMLFRLRYPKDWTRVVAKYQYEEGSTPPGKRHPMPPPDRYIREMYRNFIRRWRDGQC